MNPNNDILDKEDKEDIELNEYSKLIDSQFISFQKNNEYCCKALTHSNLQCKNSSYDYNYKTKTYKKQLLCKLHRNKKYSPDYSIVYIHNDNHTKKNGRVIHKTNDDTHIIAYPYKNKEQYYKDIDIYKQELKDNYVQNLIKIKQITTCKVCNDIFTNNDLIKCSYSTCDNKHLVCSSCLIGYIDSQIANNIGTYECMFNKADKCNGEYKPSIVNEIIHNDTKDDKLSKWTELVNITDIYKLSNICDNYIICPLCRSWGCILEIEPGNNEPINIKCLNCNLEWCNLCKRQAHNDSSCYKLIFTDTETLEKRTSIVDTMIQNIITKTLTHTCSTCSSAYIKEDGCNLMNCSRCGGMSCYICNTKIYYKEGRGKYWHFVGHELSEIGATCSLWNKSDDAGNGGAGNAGAYGGAAIDEANIIKKGNVEYNTKKIITELILFLGHNHNSETIQQLIYNRIRCLYEKDEEYKFITEEFVKLDIK